MRLLSSAVLFVAMAVSISGQSAQKPKKFLTAPLTIEDQGSFFIGGVQKVTYQAAPTPPATSRWRRIKSRSARCMCSSKSRRRSTARLARYHGSRLEPYGCMPGVHTRRPRRLVSLLRSSGRSQLRRRSGRSRPLGLRRVRDSRGRGQMVAGDPRGADSDPCLRPDHRRRRVDQLVRAPRAGELYDPDRQADSARRSGRSEPASGRYRTSRRPFPLDSVDSQISRAPAPSAPRRRGAPETFALEYYKQLVPNAEVTLPGSICNTCDPKAIAPANTWTPENLASLVERLGGAIVVTHSQSGIMGHHMARILKERGISVS